MSIAGTVELNPHSAAGHGLLGMVRQAQGRPADAIKSFEKALEIDPTNDYALGELARVYFMVGLENESRAQYRKALTTDPLQPIYHSGLFLVRRA